VNPPNYYGRSKYEGELEALKRENTLVLRTNIFGWNVQNKYSIAEWILHELMGNREITGFNDVFFSSIYNFKLAKILELAINKDFAGIYNCASSTSASKYEFAVHIADCFNLDRNLIKPMSVDEYPLIAKRGKNLTLNVDKLAKALNCNLPSIEESIEDFHRDFLDGLPERIRTNIHAYPVRQPLLPYGRQLIDEGDIGAVVEVLKSTHLTQGPNVSEFEAEI